MTQQPRGRTEEPFSAAIELLSCIDELAAHHSNPVLDVLREADTLEEERKYPQAHLRFSGIGLRAYYHCHSRPRRLKGEHGHFHLFVKGLPGPDDQLDNWAHLAGLSMDQMGQPLRWFAVNHWVTGGAWLPAPDLTALLDALPVPARTSLTERWLFFMARLYRADLGRLLQARDRRLDRLALAQPAAAARQDRSIYTLATRKIDLLDTLQRRLGATS